MSNIPSSLPRNDIPSDHADNFHSTRNEDDIIQHKQNNNHDIQPSTIELDNTQEEIKRSTPEPDKLNTQANIIMHDQNQTNSNIPGQLHTPENVTNYNQSESPSSIISGLKLSPDKHISGPNLSPDIDIPGPKPSPDKSISKSKVKFNVRFKDTNEKDTQKRIRLDTNSPTTGTRATLIRKVKQRPSLHNLNGSNTYKTPTSLPAEEDVMMNDEVVDIIGMSAASSELRDNPCAGMEDIPCNDTMELYLHTRQDNGHCL